MYPSSCLARGSQGGRSHGRSCFAVGLVWLAVSAGFVTAVQAQVVRLDAGSGELGVRFEGVRSGFIGGPSTAANDFREWLKIPLSGSLFDARILSYDLDLRPTLQQRNQADLDQNLNSRQLDLSFAASALSAQPVSFVFGLARSGGTSSGGFGSQRDFRQSYLTGGLSWRNGFFPVQLTYFRQEHDDTWQSAPGVAPFRTAMTVKRYQLSASSSKASLNVHRYLYDDWVGVNDFKTWNVLARHEFRWGRDSRLESSFEHLDQTGQTTRRRGFWSERLRLQHSAWLSSHWFYRRTSARSNGESTRSDGFGGGFNGRLARWSSAGIHATRYVSKFGGVRETVSTITPRLQLTLPLPAGFDFGASASVGYEKRDRTGESDSYVPVVDERYEVPASRSFTLDETDVDIGSVTIRSSDGTLVFLENTDYLLIPIGASVRVDIPPGSRIEVGATVLASYRFLLPSSERPDAFRIEYDLSLDFGGLSLRHRRSLRDSRGVIAGAFIDGHSATISDFDDARTSLNARGGSPLGQVDVSASYRRNDRHGQLMREYEIGAGLVPPPVGRLQASLGVFGSQSRSDLMEARSVSGNLFLSTYAMRTLRLGVGVQAYTWWQTGVGTQRFLSGTLGGEWNLDLYEIQFRYEHHRRDFVTMHTLNRLFVSVLRRF